jgi:hypothetical protein
MRLSSLGELIKKDIDNPYRWKSFFHPKNLSIEHQLIWFLPGIKSESELSECFQDREWCCCPFIGLDWFRELVLDRIIFELIPGRLSESFYCAEKYKIMFLKENRHVNRQHDDQGSMFPNTFKSSFWNVSSDRIHRQDVYSLANII